MLAGTRSTPWLAILLKVPSGNPGVNWAPSRAGTLCFLLTTGTTLKQIFLQPLNTIKDRWSCPSFRLSAFSEPTETCSQSSCALLEGPTSAQDAPPATLTALSSHLQAVAPLPMQELWPSDQMARWPCLLHSDTNGFFMSFLCQADAQTHSLSRLGSGVSSDPKKQYPRPSATRHI